jgi:hypothetical protein
MPFQIQSDDDVVRLTAAAVLNCGQAVLVPDGRVGIVQNMAPVAIGEVATVKIRGIVKGLAAANLAAGVTAAIHIANQTVIATGGAGTDAGKLLYACTSGGDAYIDLNP